MAKISLKPDRWPGLVLLCVSALVVGMGAGWGVSELLDEDDPGRLPTPCERVTVLTGQRGSPYNEYGQLIARLIREAGVEEAVAEITAGTNHNLEEVNDQGKPNKCTVAMVQLPTAVDARYLRGPWLGEDRPRLDNIVTVGQVYYDIVHVIVRTEADLSAARETGDREPRLVEKIEDLCDPGVRVDAGVAESGNHAVGMIIKNILGGVDGCPWQDVNSDGVDDNFPNLSYSLSRLRDGWVDAVIWVGGSPTSTVENFAASVQGGPEMRVLPLEPACREGGDGPTPGSFLASMEEDWEVNFRRVVDEWNEEHRTQEKFYPGQVYTCQVIRPGDYSFVVGGGAETSTVGVPNALVAHRETDPELVGFLAEALVDNVDELQRSIWGDDEARMGRQFPAARLGDSSAGNPLRNPLFCFVPLHDATAAYYEDEHGLGVADECAARLGPAG